MSHNPAEDLLDFLDTNSTALTQGTNLFHGPPRPVGPGMPEQAVFVIGRGGPPPKRVFTQNTEVRDGAVQVITRSNSWATGFALAQTVHNLAQSATISGYEDVKAKQPEPAFLDQDNQGRYSWSDNYELMYNSTD